jgi:hypothetical protein
VDVASEFAGFVEDFFAAEFRWNPASATEAGLHDHDPDLGPRSREAHQARIDEVRGLRDRAGRLSGTSLSSPDRIDLELISGRMDADLLDLDDLETWRTNPIGYLWSTGRALDGLIKREFAPGRERLRALTSRLRAVPQVLGDMRSNIAAPPRVFTEVALRLAKGSIGFLDEGLETWAGVAASGAPELASEFRMAHSPAVIAMEEAARWLEELLPRSTGRFAIGREALGRMLRFEEMTLTPLDSLLGIAEANLARDHRAFIEAADRVAPGRTPVEAIRELSCDRPGEDQLIEWTSASLERARAFLDARSIVTMPSLPPPRITETPPYYRFGAFAAMDSPGAYEQVARDAFYYVTPPEKDWSREHKEEHLRLFNRPVMDLITIHETYPGHFLQFAHSPRFPTHTRRLLSCGSNVEGWAHYVEQMVVEEGYGDLDPRIRMAQLQEALIRDCRFVAAIGLHTGTMDLPEAARLFEDRACMEPANAREEARRGTFDPTYLVYTLGKLQIWKLRDDWEAIHGAGLSGGGNLSAFHDAFLREGGAPLAIIRRRLLGRDESETLYPASFYEVGTGRRRDH